MRDAKRLLIQEVVNRGICVGCGACLVNTPVSRTRMSRKTGVLIPDFENWKAPVDEIFWEACPGKGVDYPKLYEAFYGGPPEDWRLGIIDRVWVGSAADQKIRVAGASGGVTTAVLIHLLESGRIDGAALVKQGIPTPEEASFFIARSKEEILACAQSVYIPVSVLDSLREFKAGERVAMTCVPEQSAALRVLQLAGIPEAQQVKYVLGPYTGTALDSRAIRSLLRSRGIDDRDAITSLAWRAGEWPGYLQVHTASGRVIRSRKIYYNFLTPFFITQASLQSMDFANEFTDLSIGDAWSPKYESLGQGYSVVASRSRKMTEIILEMESAGLLELESTTPLEASVMHGHMIDFKKRGGYLRNRWRRLLGKAAPDYGLAPSVIGVSRVAVEIVISAIFLVCRVGPARWLVERIPERILGPLFNRLRLAWKSASKPTKRKNLKNLVMARRTPVWRNR